MKTLEVYNAYHIPDNLREHMLRVAAVGYQISKAWKTDGEIDTENIVRTLLVHDMANILKYDFNSSLHLMGSQQSDVFYWRRIQSEFKSKYGANEHLATIAIARQIGLNALGIRILELMSEVNLQKPIEEGNWGLKICFYADMRVSPYGITETDKRMDDLIIREQAKKSPLEEIERLKGIKIYLHQLETQLQDEVSVPLSSIDEATYSRLKKTLENFQISQAA